MMPHNSYFLFFPLKLSNIPKVKIIMNLQEHNMNEEEPQHP